jgi:hypothetical protein
VVLKGTVAQVDSPVMAAGSIRRRLRALARSEDGMALPTALFAMIAGLALASAAVLSSVNVQQGTARDHDSKEAIAAADAGASIALLRLNRFQSKLSPTNRCVGPAGESLAESPEFPGWCPTTPVESVGGATFFYRASAYSPTGTLSVVAVGTSGTVSRRVEVGLFSEGGNNVFADEKLIGQDGIEIKGNPYIHTSIGTNGSITGKGSYTICGDERHGVGKEAPTPSCGGEKLEGEKTLPPVVAPADIATHNWNCRLAANCVDKAEVDTYAKLVGKKVQDKRTSKEPWEATPRNINVNGEATLTMGGRDYFVCKINLQSGELIMAADANVRIFVDTPENCGLSAGATQVEIGANSKVVSTGYNPEQGTYDVLGIYMLGSGAVKLDGTTKDELVLYAPESEIEIKGNATWIGMIAGKTLNIPGNPTIEFDANIEPPDYTVASLLRRTRYVECTGGTAPSPAASC